MSRILVTGGCGYIGSHTCLTLLEQNHELIVFDDFSNSSPLAIERVIKIAKISNLNKIELIKGDIRSLVNIENVFKTYSKNNKPIDSVIHFAGLKSVRDSVLNPMRYWEINVIGSHNLLKVMDKYNCKTLVFSSSATIYGDSEKIPTSEDAKIKPLNPYGNTKAAVEKLLFDVAKCKPDSGVIQKSSSSGWRIARLRYFNPVGAHQSGLIGESPIGTPSNLFPMISDVAIGKRDTLNIFGKNWPTPDGTGIRDYIHVMDLASGHLAALDFLLNSKPQLLTLNLGTGKGTSVMQAVKTFEKVSKQTIKYKILNRRSGDTAITIADASMAEKYLKWTAKRGLDEMCASSWNWQKTNPNGYDIN